MWLPLTLLVLAGIVSADFEHGWKSGNEYTYLVRSRTLTSLDKLSDQHTGILIKALLTIHVTDSSRLIAEIRNGKYASIHKSLPEGWDTEISDQMLEFRDLPVTMKPFEIKLKHGVIRDVIVNKNVPTWEVNLLKSIVGQLQVDSQGENTIKSKDVQIPDDDKPFGSFRVMEDSVTGKCEVHYDITPLSDNVMLMKPELVPMPKLKGKGHHIDITKTKNFDNCDQRMNYHFGIPERNNWEPGSNKNGKFLSRSSTSKIVISGNLKSFTIQSSVTTSKIVLSPRLMNKQSGMVVSQMNVTLAKLGRISRPLPSVMNSESTGNLVYQFNDPFSNTEERRMSQARTLNSNQVRTSDSVSSVSSSEEAVKKGETLPSLSSSYSKSSSSISSSEENDFWQPKPTLEDAPRNPLLPNFIGYYGKVIEKSGKVDIVGIAGGLISEIANELGDPSNILAQETLDKFTILCSLIRVMNRQQISNLQNSLHISANELKAQPIKQDIWAVFRDAVTQAGTGPALLTIKSLIMDELPTTMEAMDILSRIPKTARTPTAQYIKTFFEIVTSPVVRQTQFLESTGLVAFAELVRHSQVNTMSIHNRFPVHTFGRFTSKHDLTVQDEYIPYLAGQLKDAMKNGDNQRIQTLILALGTIGHPKILSVFEPYLEGKQSVTVFQRTLMVSALGRLIETNPKLAQAVLYRIYLNTMENHNVRCTAVFLLMKTNPPLRMLQRMAEFTNFDTNKHVNSAVKSSLESLAKLTSPESKELAKKARSAMELMTAHDHSFQYSHGYIMENIDANKNVMWQMVANYIGSDDSAIPHALYLGWFSSYGDFKMPASEFWTIISSMRNLLDIEFKEMKDKQSVKWAAEKIAEKLNIIADEPVPLEGNMMWNDKYQTMFLPFTGSFLRKLPTLIGRYLVTGNVDRPINLNKLVSYDVTLAFPTETGLPFVYTFRLPILYRINGEGQTSIIPNGETSIDAKLRMVYSKKIQGRIGFVVPFEHQHYIAGVDANYQVFAPVRFSTNINPSKSAVQLKLWPLKGEEQARLVHYSVIPYTANHDILNVRPVLTEKTTHPIKPEDSRDTVVLSATENMPLKIVAQGDNQERLDLAVAGMMLFSLWTTSDNKFRKADVLMDLQGEQKEPLVLSVSIDSLSVAPKDNVAQEWTAIAQAVEPSEKTDMVARKKQLMEEAAKGIKLADSDVMDIELTIPGKHKIKTTLTAAYADSSVESKERILFYWRFEASGKPINGEMCAALQTASKPENVVSFEDAIRSKFEEDFEMNVRFGETCSNGEQINIKGKAKQSDELKETIKDLPLVKMCQKQMEQGNKYLRACRKAAVRAMTLNEVNVSMNTQSDITQDVFDNFLLNSVLLANDDTVQVDISKPKNAGKKKIDIEAKLSSDFKTLDVAVHAPKLNILVDDIDLSELSLDDVMVGGKLDTDLLIHDEDEPVCVLDKTRAETFDGKEYPLRLGNCWHVVMTTFPKVNPENPNEKLPIPEESNLSILTKDTSAGQREVDVRLGNMKVKLLPTSSQPRVTVNDENVEITWDKSFQKRKDNKVILEIYKAGERSIGLFSGPFKVDLVFDGERLMIQTEDAYRNSIRGLCGNFDSDSSNDFTGPKSCMMRKPELFIASYALTNDQCEGDSLQNAQLINDLTCIKKSSNLQSDVINDIESGRAKTLKNSWGYHNEANGGKGCSSVHRIKVLESDDKICFSTRPVITCAPGCSATETKSKSYQFHCMEKTQHALNLKGRIEKGANPDLSQKDVSMNHPVTVPLACVA